MRRVLRRTLLIACVLALAFHAFPVAAFAQSNGGEGVLQPGASEQDGASEALQPGASENDGAEELILAISYPPYVLSSGFLAAQIGDAYYLPLVELCQIFDFFVEHDAANGRYHGYFKDEKSSFGIDTQKNEIESKGSISPLSPDMALVDPFGEGSDDIYVRVDVLNNIWPVDITVNISTLSMLVKTTEKLAFELKLEREENRVLAMARKAYSPTANMPKLPFIANPYKLIGKPAVDIDTDYNWDHENKVLEGRSTFSGTMDLAGASADFSATTSYMDGRFHKPETIRLRLTRESFGDETMPLGFRHAEGGDVSISHRSLIGGSSAGRGLTATSLPTQRKAEFDQITVEGTGIVGWEVELYRNDILETFTTVDEKGEYRFEDVPLSVGNNQIRVVLYGPQGQVQERIENYNVSGGMTKPGQTDYSVGVVDSDRPFVMLAGRQGDPLRGLAGNAYAAHGLNQQLTVFGSVSKLPTQKEEKSYATAGVMASFLNSLGQAEFFKEANGGHAIDLRLATQLLGLRLNLQSAFFRHFDSPDAGFDDSAKTYEGEVRASTNVKTPIGGLGMQFSGKHRESKSSLPFSTASFQQSLGLSGIRLTQSTTSNFDNYIHQSSVGKLTASVRIQQWQLRSQLDYNIYPRKELSSGNAELRYRGRDGFSAAVNAQHSFLTRDQSAGFQVGYDFGSVLGSLDLGWVKEGGYNVAVRASTSLGPYGRDGKYIVDSKKMSRDAPVQARTFLDHDRDGVFSEGDEPVPEAQLLMNRQSNNERGDEEGYVIARNGPSGDIVNIELNKSALIDPYYQPGIPGYSTVLRPGSMPMFDFPVIETGAIDGTAYREGNVPISGMKLELVDEGGAVVQTTETAYDGFYTFEFVPPGTYSVRADPSYGVNVPPETVTVTSEDLFAYGIDLQLLEQAEEVEAADEAEEGDEPSSVDEAESESGGVAHTHHERSNGTLQPAPLSTEGDLSAFVKRVRIGEHPDKVRLVLDLSGPIVYSMGFADGGKTMHIDLPGVAWDAMRIWRGSHTPVIESYEVQALAGGGTRLVIHGRGPIASGLNGVLKPADGQSYRLYIDLHGN